VSHAKKVIVIGLDGLEPTLVEPLVEAGALPNMARVRERGGLTRVETTHPAQTPVAWSTFATGLNPGGHGIFDFIRRDPRTYLPELAFSRYEQKNPLLPPRAVNLRGGDAIWDYLDRAGIPSVVLRCPCTYPAERVRGRLLSGMGVPDLRGGLGTSTMYVSANGSGADEDRSPGGQRAERNVVRVQPNGDGVICTVLLGPLSPKDRRPARFDVTIELRPAASRVVIRSAGAPKALEIREGSWSDWLRVKFKLGALQSVRGMVRFYLARVEPQLELYASPVNFTPESPPFPISSPPEYAGELAGRIGTFYTTGMIEDHDALKDGHIDEDVFLSQCEQAWREREAMMLYELDRFDEGFFFCLFDTPDRVQHMFWRFREPDHPANREGFRPELAHVVEDEYRRCDAVVGKALEYVDDRTLLVVLSDHGFASFRRGVHLNTWLHDRGDLVLADGVGPGEEAGELFRHVDWSHTKAYALGLGGIYLNLAGREREGVVPPEEAASLKRRLARELAEVADPQGGRAAVRSVALCEEVYRGPYVEAAPDLVVNFAHGYRASWTTALGGLGDGLFEDNTARWAGDHIIDPALVPGVLLTSRPLRAQSPRLVDLAPTILHALGVPMPPTLEGESLLTLARPVSGADACEAGSDDVRAQWQDYPQCSDQSFSMH
jgi:predicted AlkP superfamily phosphohydrolase/phosphomutase